ncbi:MAG: hypothetical protein ACYDA3_04315 [Gaiellaceae bacterium]
MKQSKRLAALAVAGFGALLLAGTALATPKLIIGGKLGLGGSGAVVQITEDKSDAAPAKITIYSAQGYAGTVTGTPGTQIGTVHADLQALAISPDAIVQADGTVLEGDGSSATLRAAATQCTGTPTHTAVWLLHVTVSGTTLDVPVYVDAPSSATDPLAQGAPFQLTLCLASPYAEAGAARAAFGAKIINAAITLNQGIIVNPSSQGVFPWRSIITPYTVNSGTPNAAGTVEARAFVGVPGSLTLSAKVRTTRHKVKVHGKKKTVVTNAVILTGFLSEGGTGIAGIKVVILSGPTLAKLKSRGTATTSSSGSFSRLLGLPKKSSFMAKVTVGVRDVTSSGCATPTPGIPCVSATAPGFSTSSALTTAAPAQH